MLIDEKDVELMHVDLVLRRNARARNRTGMIDKRDQVGVVEIRQLLRRHHVAEVHECRIVVDRVRAEIDAETAPITGEVDMRQAVRS